MPATETAPAAASHLPRRFIPTAAGLALLVGTLSGSLSALFLWSLDRTTALRFAHPQLLLALPLVGVLSVGFYRKFGGEATRGNCLILERIRLRNGPVPTRMVSLIFTTSALSHLVGASVGREGAAVQMGAGLAAAVLRVLRLPRAYVRPLLVAGVAAGFASIFGTPLAGAIFAVEAPTPKRPYWSKLPVALLAAYTGDFVCRAWGAHHTAYAVNVPALAAFLDARLCCGLLLAALLFGWTGQLFVRLHLGIKTGYQKLSRYWWLPPVLGGLLLLALSHLPSMDSYLGLGTWSPCPEAVTITSAFTPGGASNFSWLDKLGFTALSLGSGFKGGEVTPLFFTGATLGNAIAANLGLSTSFFAALGFVAVFSGAAHTPLTGVFMALELFGITACPVFAPVCWIAHWACGNHGLYAGQDRD